MASSLVVISGDNPVEINPGDGKQFKFGFPETERPDPSKPAILLLNVQNLIERSNVKLNGSSIGYIYPTLGFSVQNTLTSPKYGGNQFYLYAGDAGTNALYVKVDEFLKDVSGGSLNLSDSYWSTQMINVSGGYQLNEQGFTQEGFEADYNTGTNRLSIESVSQSFKVKDIFLHYHFKQTKQS
ncbi:MAG: hypothetical protein F6K37_29770 [Moorea sp. SIO4E2]|uniref:hypothetical protein n=1 Tax=Moorena sp. SIO4E2 TaxID=2607826 RepID=UPI0013BE88D1|nr:hypothetical protein [Moorena sp. SIO4E2]NEQ09973.1 hypothetical protein [Moorena sp. SIO4E2]